MKLHANTSVSHRRNLPDRPFFRVKMLSFLTGGVIGAALLPPNSYAELPDPCRGGCGAQQNLNFVQSGAATINTNGNVMTINQTSNKAVLNWNTFNVSKDATVNFVQNDKNSAALNRIFANAPSQILGNLNANGQVYLINPSGILFGRDAKINVGGLVASTLNVDTDLFVNKSIGEAYKNKVLPTSSKDSYAALRKDDTMGTPNGDQNIVVEEGASITTKDGGSVTLVGKNVVNAGTVTADGGQAMLIASEDRVFLRPSDNSELRGFLVEVDTGGTVTNTGTVQSKRGNVTMVGNAVNQNGKAISSTTVSANGSITLKAQDKGDVEIGQQVQDNSLQASRSGKLQLGENSLTDVELELDSVEKAVDDLAQVPSRITMAGKTIHIKENAKIVAHGGVVTATSRVSPQAVLTNNTVDNNRLGETVPASSEVATRDDLTYIQMDKGATIDVKGADATLDMSRNFVTLQLYSSELKDSPLQRNGILKGEAVTVDIRKGTPLADISGAVAAIPKTLAERSSAGGEVYLFSQGAVSIDDEAKIDISGGVVTYNPGEVQTTQLLSNGRIIDISQADPSMIYDGILGVMTRADASKGIVYVRGRAVANRYTEAGYQEGRDAGSIQIAGNNLQIDGDIVSNTFTGKYQTSSATQANGGRLTIGSESVLNKQVNNLAPNVLLSANAVAQSPVDLVAIEDNFRTELKSQLLLEHPEYTQEQLENAIQLALEDDEVRAQLQSLLADPFAKSGNTLVLNTDKLSQSGLGFIDIKSNGLIKVEASERAWKLPENTAVKLSGARVEIDRSIQLPGGRTSYASWTTKDEKTFNKVTSAIDSFSAQSKEIDPSIQVNVLPNTGIANGVQIGDGVSLDVSGRYVNNFNHTADNLQNKGATNAGSIALRVDVGDTLKLGNGVSLLADGGAYESETGSITAGKAGAITLSASANNATLELGTSIVESENADAAVDAQIAAGLNLSARGLANNGSLTIEANNFHIVNQLALTAEASDFAKTQFDNNVHNAGGIMVLAPTGEGQSSIVLEKSFFENGAFANYSFATLNNIAPEGNGNIVIEKDTQLNLQQINNRLLDNAARVGQADSLAGLTSTVLLDERLRNPVNISFKQQAMDSSDDRHDFVLGSNASITTEGGGKINILNATGGRILLDGTLQADGGSISVALEKVSSQPVDDGSMIWIGEHGKLLARGFFDETYDGGPKNSLAEDLVQGTLKSGGTIDLASSGYLVTEKGALLDVSGINTDMDVFVGSRRGQTNLYERRQFAGEAGKISLTSGEGIVFAGDMQANSDVISKSVDHGTLAIHSTIADRKTSIEAEDFPARTIVLHDANYSAEPMTASLEFAVEGVDSQFLHTDATGNVAAIGVGSLSADNRGVSNFNARNLGNTFDNVSITTDGELNFSADQGHTVDFGAAHSLRLNAANISVSQANGEKATVNLAAQYIALGSATTPAVRNSTTDRMPNVGPSTLNVTADNIDLIDSSYFDGINSLNINAASDVRLISEGESWLRSTGNIDITGRQVVAMTDSSLTVQALDYQENNSTFAGHIGIHGNGRSPVAALAAQGQVTLQAADIEQQGTLKAPFGVINLDATHLSLQNNQVVAGESGHLHLAEGSVTSTSLNNEVVPYGTTVNGLEWYYSRNMDKVFTNTEQKVITPGVNLKGDSVELATGATVDVSGGGDLMAYEFVPGLGGSKDYLGLSSDLDASVQRFAIVPRLNDATLPYDRAFASGANSGLSVGETIEIGAGSIVPAGDYVLMPAQYALLPGAYLVERKDNYANALFGRSTFKTLDGTSVVAGNRGIAGTDFGDGLTEGYLLRPGSDARQFSEYRETSANTFFDQRAEQLGLAVTPPQPLNAGSLSVVAETGLAFGGNVRGEGGEGGQKAALDISADHILVADAQAMPGEYNGIVLTDDQLNGLDVGSLLLGGRRTASEKGVSVEVRADTVEVAGNVALTHDEILLAALESINVDSGASIQSTAPATHNEKQISITHGGALLGVSNQRITAIQRGSESIQSNVTLGAGAVLTSADSAFMDGTGTTTLDGTLQAPGAVLLGAGKISLGAPEDGSLVLSQSALNSLGKVELLALQAKQSITLHDGVDVIGKQVQLAAPVVRGELSANGVASIQAETLEVRGGDAAASLLEGSGSLNISAQNIVYKGGNLVLGGVDALTMNASGLVTLAGDGTWRMGAKSTQITAPIVTAESGVTSTLAADGTLALSGGEQAAVDVTSSGIGASVNVTGTSVAMDNHWLLSSGLMSVTATTGDLQVGEHALLDASGTHLTVFEKSYYTDGGKIGLTSQQGNLNIASGAVIDISAQAGGGNAGSIALSAAQGNLNTHKNLKADSAQGGGGGLSVDAKTVAGGLHSLAEFFGLANAEGDVNIRLRGDESQAIDNNDEWKASSFTLSLDNADLAVNGLIDTSAEKGGDVAIQVNGNLAVNNGARILAQGSGSRGGDVLLSSHAGKLAFEQGATVDVSSATNEGGKVRFRADADDVSGIAIDDGHFGGAVVGASRKVVEARKIYNDNDDKFTSSDWTNLHALAQTVTNAASAIKARLGLGDDVDVAAALEVDRIGDYTWTQQVNFRDWATFLQVPDQFHPNDLLLTDQMAPGSILPGSLIVRATGNLTVNKSLQDGFRIITNPAERSLRQTVLGSRNSWGLEFTAGADLNAADAASVISSSPADFVLGNNTKIVTGNADISVHASHDIKFGNAGSVIYSAGRDVGHALDRHGSDVPFYVQEGEDKMLLTDTAGMAGLKMTPDDGGNVTLSAGNDILGYANNDEQVQVIRDWFNYTDAVSEAYDGDILYQAREDAGIFINFANFKQGIAGFGGGSININAGRDIVRLDASVPTTMSLDSDSLQVHRYGAGDLHVNSGRNLVSSDFFVGDGHAVINADSAIISDRNVWGIDVPGYYALMGGQMTVSARKDATVYGAINPTLLDLNPDYGPTSYVSFTTATAFQAKSLAGNVIFDTNGYRLDNLTLPREDEGFVYNGDVVSWVPGKFGLYAFDGDITVNGNLQIPVHVDSYVDLIAGQNIDVKNVVALHDYRYGDDLPGLDAPAYQDLFTSNGLSTPPTRPAIAAMSDSSMRTVIAGVHGNVSIDSVFDTPTAFDIYAGKDITGMVLHAQQYHESDVSRLWAQRDINFGTAFDLVSLAGPGRLEVIAGRNIDLGKSKGIETTGETTNTQLHGLGGADVYMFAGTSPTDIRYQSFIAPMLQNSTVLDQFASDLQHYVASVTGESLSQREAAEKFRTLSSQLQAAFKPSSNGADVGTLLTALACNYAIGDHLYQSAAYAQLIASMQANEQTLQLLASALAARKGVSSLDVSQVSENLAILSSTEQQKVLQLALGSMDEVQRRQWVSQSFALLSDSDRKPLVTDAFFNELVLSGRNANAGAPEGYDRGYNAVQNFFASTNYQSDKKLDSQASGDISLLFSKVYTLDGGDINLFAPGGGVNGGVVALGPNDTAKEPSELGIVAQGDGAVNAYVHKDFIVNQSRVFTLREGNIAMWSSTGNIDAGRGAKSAVSAPKPTVVYDAVTGTISISVTGAIAGSGIRQINTKGEETAFDTALKSVILPNSVDLIAPVGEVNAGDAGIGASGNINIAAARVIGADNIEVGGVSVGVPLADSGNFTGGFSGSESTSNAINKASDDAGDSDTTKADEALSWLDVFVVGYGDETNDDEEDKKRKSAGKG